MKIDIKIPTVLGGDKANTHMKGVFAMDNIITKSGNIPVHAENGRVVGKVEGDTFYKSVKGSKHFLRVPPAIAFDVISLDDAEEAGAEKVVVTDQETGTVYKSTIQHIREHGEKFNRGFGDQIFLVLEGWVKSKRGGGLQLGLWE
jgi:hypothetical protein